MIQPFDLTDQHVVIAGGSSGIGLGVARMVIDLGGRVSLLSRSRAKLNQAERVLEAKAASYVVDVTDGSALSQVLAEIGGVDHLVTTVGGTPLQGSLGSIGTDGLAKVFAEKCLAQLRIVEVAAPHMPEHG